MPGNPVNLIPAIELPGGVVMRGGCVRMNPTGPYLHYETNHVCAGLTGVALDGSDLLVTTDWASGEKIITPVSVTDYQLAEKGFFTGVSGGATTWRIGIWYRNYAGTLVQVSPKNPMFSNDLFNIWLFGMSIRGL